MITSKDYSAQAYRDLIRTSKIFAQQYDWVEDSKTLSELARRIDKSVHFSLPDGGAIIQDGLKGIWDQDIRLPFPRITLSFDDTINNSKRVIIAEEVFRKDVQTFNTIEDPSKASEMVLRITSILPNSTFNWLPDFYANCIPCQNWSARDDNSTAMMYTIINELVLPGMETSFKDMLKESFKTLEEGGKEISLDSTVIVLDFLEALSCTNVTYEPIKKITNIDRQKRKRISKLPLYEINVLTIKPTIKKKLSNNTSTGIIKNSPREHLRRGHIRQLDENRKIWVNACIVNAGSLNGKIDKSYAITK